MTLSPPFFILGCVRSGTTMLRDILRRHPALACPEETQYYRWGEPFRGPVYRNVLTGNATLKHHRKLDGLTEPEFLEMLNQAKSRAELYQLHMARYIALRKPGATRWFDKSPQNAYGAAIIAADFPRAKFVHMVRDPVNVVASLRIGKVVKVDDLIGACSYWNDAIANLSTLKRAYPSRVLEISYEAFTADAAKGIQSLLEFIGEPYDSAWFSAVRTAEVRHDAADASVLSQDELATVRAICLQGRVRHGYAPATDKDLRRAEKLAGREKRRRERAIGREPVDGSAADTAET